MLRSAELEKILSGYAHIIRYAALRTEVPLGPLLSSVSTARFHEIPARASLDPIEEAARIAGTVGEQSAIICIPGRRFDTTGTRHGQGGGWYDRFLAEVPREWLRIGFCFSDQLSDVPLRREPWDQPMDYVAALDRQTGTVTLLSSE